MSSDRLSEPTLETLIGPYRLVRRVGEGGMAIVWEAEHTGLKKRVALKMLVPRLAKNAKVVARFRREGEAMARIRHPNVVDVSDVGDFQGQPFLVMEFLNGENLGALLERESVLTVQRTADLLLPVIAAICAAHRESVVHRDLKPDNLFLAQGPDGTIVPKVVDFGISKLAGAVDLTGTQEVMGTPSYMSPEQIEDPKRVDARSDQFSLGGILYECLTGRRAFDGELALQVMFKIANGKFEPPRRLRPDLSVAIEGVILRAMATRPDGRFPTTADLGQALLPFASPNVRANVAGQFGASTLGPSPFFLRGRRWMWPGLALLLCAAGAGSLMLRSSSHPPQRPAPSSVTTQPAVSAHPPAPPATPPPTKDKEAREPKEEPSTRKRPGKKQPKKGDNEAKPTIKGPYRDSAGVIILPPSKKSTQ